MPTTIYFQKTDFFSLPKKNPTLLKKQINQQKPQQP